MGSNDELDSLLKQKAELSGRTDLTPEQKDKLARTLRRKIRQLGGTCRVLDGGVVNKSEKTETGEKVPRARSSRFIKKIRPHQQLAYNEYWETITKALVELGLERKSRDSIMGLNTYGYSIPLMHRENVTALELIDKFKHRWSSHAPQWFYPGDQEIKEYILLGPIPFRNDP